MSCPPGPEPPGDAVRTGSPRGTGDGKHRPSSQAPPPVEHSVRGARRRLRSHQPGRARAPHPRAEPARRRQAARCDLPAFARGGRSCSCRVGRVPGHRARPPRTRAARVARAPAGHPGRKARRQLRPRRADRQQGDDRRSAAAVPAGHAVCARLLAAPAAVRIRSARAGCSLGCCGSRCSSAPCSHAVRGGGALGR